MCDPVVGFAVLGGAQAVAGQMGKMSKKNAANEAKLDDYENRKTNYTNNLAIDFARYRNDKIDYQINSDVIFRSFVAKYLGDQTRINALEKAELRGQEKDLIGLAKKAYAGPLTGVTGARLAAQPLREIGLARSARVAQLTEKTEAIQAGSEFDYENVINKLGREYGKVAMAPVAGFEPLAPELDYDAELGTFAMNLATGIAGGAMMGKSLKAPTSGGPGKFPMDIADTSGLAGPDPGNIFDIELKGPKLGTYKQ